MTGVVWFKNLKSYEKWIKIIFIYNLSPKTDLTRGIKENV